MRLFILGFYLFLSVTLSAQSVFDENMISGDDLREMLVKVFESSEGETILQVDSDAGQDILLLINSSVTVVSAQLDVRNALIDLKNNPYDLDLASPVQIFEESNQSEISQSERLRAISLGVQRIENRTTLYLKRDDIARKNQYNLFAIFEKEGEDWTLITQNLATRP